MSNLNDPPDLIADGVLELPPRGVNHARDLIDAINCEHDLLVEGQRRGLERARRIGELLIDLKPRVGHGNWEDFVDRNFVFAFRTAQLYTKLARKWPRLEAVFAEKAQDLALLSLEGAMYILAHGWPVEDGGEDDDDKPKKPKKKAKPKIKYRPLIALDEPLRFCCPNCRHEWVGDPLAGEQKEEEPQAA